MTARVLTFFAAAIFSAATSAFAGVILSPISASLSGATVSGYPNQLVDGIGHSSAFVSGVTDFNAYFSAGPTYPISGDTPSWNAGDATSWTGPASTQYIDFSFAEKTSVARFALENGFGQGDFNFTVYASDDPTFGIANNLGSFSAQIASNIYRVVRKSDGAVIFPYQSLFPIEWNGYEFATYDHIFYGSQNLIQVFDIANVYAQYFRLQIDSNTGDSIRLTEVAFEESTNVPEPNNLALFAIACASLGLFCRCRTSSNLRSTWRSPALLIA